MNKKLRNLREENGFTQKEMANFLNMPYRTYQNYELGTSNISDWVFDLIEYKVKMKNTYSPNEGTYKIKQIKVLIKPVMKKFKVTKVYLYGEYAIKDATPLSYIKLVVKSKLDGKSYRFLKEELEKVLKKNVEILNYYELDKRSEFLKNILLKGILIYSSY